MSAQMTRDEWSDYGLDITLFGKPIPLRKFCSHPEVRRAMDQVYRDTTSISTHEAIAGTKPESTTERVQRLTRELAVAVADLGDGS